MKYPKFLKDNQTIGIIAPSCGSNKGAYRIRTSNAIKYFTSTGYTIKKGHRIFRMNKCVSAPADVRANDFMSMYRNKKVDMVWSIAGGEIMMTMLPFLDFEKIKKLPPKFFMGFSDNTNLTFTLTTICDVASIYGASFPSFGRDSFNEDTIDSLKLLKGEKLAFDSYPFYHGANSHDENATFTSPYLYLDENNYKALVEKDYEFEGRIIGGCLDVLIMLCGTRFDNVKNFIEKYKDDGIIWYFDICDLNSVGTARALFQLKEAGWLKYCKGFILSRPANYNGIVMDYQFVDAYKDMLEEFNLPVIYDSDFSHVVPTLPVLNGSIAHVSYSNGKIHIEYELR